MKFRKSMLSASIAAALVFAATAQAQSASPQNQTGNQQHQPQQLETVQVVGIRASQALSLDTKKEANSHVEVVSAVDIGKLPAKNVADTIAQLPGVNIADASGAEGGFDEADRASIRGTAPSLTMTTINGHALASGDWFVLGSGSTRSVSYAMLPSNIVSQVVVHKTSEARFLEGGAAGTIDILTRKPLEFAKPLSAEGSIGGVYSDLPSTTKPQFSGLVNWKNSANTFGVLFEAFYQERALQRNGQEMLGYNYIKSGSPAALSLGLQPATPGSPSTGVFFPDLPGAALFTQTRKRKGGSIDLEWRPFDNLTLNLDAFYSKVNARDYNRNYMLRTRDNLNNDPNVTGTIVDNILTSAQLSPAGLGGNGQGIYDMISRPGDSESAQFYTLDADWQATQNLNFKFQGGITRGTGNTPTQDVVEIDTGKGQPASYAMSGLGGPAAWSLGGDNTKFDPASDGFDWIFGEQDAHVVDREFWFQADGEYDFDNVGALQSLQFGARSSTHTHNNLGAIAQGALAGIPNNELAISGGNYPSDFASKLSVPEMPQGIWYYTPGQLAAFNAKYANRLNDGTTAGRVYPPYLYRMAERNSAAYVQVNFAGDRWGANAGLRWVATNENIGYTSAGRVEAQTDGPILNSAFYPGGWYWNFYNHHYSKVLPSFNFKYDLNGTGNLIARFAASQTLTRPDYGQVAGFLALGDPKGTVPPTVPPTPDGIGSGSGPNPYLKPLISTNFDASLEWYFAERGLLSASVYAMQLSDYYDYGSVTRQYLNSTLTFDTKINPSQTPVYSTYNVSVPTNVDGNVKGVELNYVQPIGKNFGVSVNYTYAIGHTTGGSYLYNLDGTPATNRGVAGTRPLFGTSRNTANASVYFENKTWNARINYTYRSKFYDGFVNASGSQVANFPYWQAGQGYLSASAGYTLNDHVSFTFDAMNLNNPRLRYFINGAQAGLGFGDAPEAFYVNGRQFYLTANFKL